MDKLKVAAMKLVTNDLEDNAKVGIVTFNPTARVLRGLQAFDSVTVRQSYANVILGLRGNGGTAIGMGVLKGMELLGYNYRCDSALSGYLIVLTDGEENQGQTRLPQAIRMAQCTGVVVDVISFGRSADPLLSSLARATGGKHYFSSVMTRDFDLLNILSEMVRTRVQGKNKPIDVVSKNVAYSGQATTQMKIKIDKFVRNNLYFTMSYSPNFPVNVELTNPNGVKISRANTTIYTDNTALKTITINVPGASKAGDWTLKILPRTTRSRRGAPVVSQTAQLAVSGRSDSTEEPLVLSGSLSKTTVDLATTDIRVFATAVQGVQPIDNAQIYAQIGNYRGAGGSILLKDDGVGADILAGDGIYSGFISPVALYHGAGAGKGDVGVQLVMEEPYSRSTSIEAVTANLQSLNPRKIPPAQITDLTVSPDLDKKILTLSWTAVGEDFFIGNVTSYEIQVSISENFQQGEKLTKFFSIMPSGQPQTVEVYISDLTDVNLYASGNTYYFKVRGIDVDKNFAAPSNEASGMLSEPSNLGDFSTGGLSAGAVAGIVIAVLIILALLVVVALLVLHRRGVIKLPLNMKNPTVQDNA